MNIKDFLILFLKSAYIIAFALFTSYFWFYYPNYDYEYKGILKDVELVSPYSAGYRDSDTTSVFLLHLEVEGGGTKALKKRNYGNWAKDTLLQYRGQTLTIRTLRKYTTIERNKPSIPHPERVCRIQDEEGHDLPKSSPCLVKGKIEYNAVTYILYFIGLLLCIWLLRKWIMKNIGIIILTLISFSIYLFISFNIN